jgi:hypothetical protein
MSLTTRALAGVLLISAVAGLAARQGRIDPNAVPVEKEPQHHLVFSNDFIRVVDARLPPGYTTLSHTHANDNVAITISPGRQDAAAMARIGRAGFSKGGYSHIATNAGTIELRFIVVEFLPGSEKSAAAAFLDGPAHRLETENHRVRIYRIKLAPGESLPAHRHNGAFLTVTVSGGAGPGSFEWHNDGAANSIQSGMSALEIVELEPR